MKELLVRVIVVRSDRLSILKGNFVKRGSRKQQVAVPVSCSLLTFIPPLVNARSWGIPLKITLCVCSEALQRHLSRADDL
jgi:hypothetical protein